MRVASAPAVLAVATTRVNRRMTWSEWVRELLRWAPWSLDARTGAGTGDLPPCGYYRCAGTMLTGNFITLALGAHRRERRRTSLHFRGRDGSATHRRSGPEDEI